MSSPTTIRKLGVAPLDIRLLAPFGIAGGAQDLARNLLVTLELADGTRGYGEAAPFPAYNGETQDRARAAVEAGRAIVEGEDARAWRRLSSALASVPQMVGSARAAIEMALLDALTRSAGMPLWAFFGGAETTLETDMTITTGSAEQARQAALDATERGMRTLKVKIGGASRKLDVERVATVHAAAPEAALVLDGNGAYTTDAALELTRSLRALRIPLALFEQPVAGTNFEGLGRLTREAGVRIAADESVVSAADALRIARERSAHVVNVKLMKSGIAEALDIVAIARAAGIGLMIGGMVESVLAMTVSACFAAGLGGFSFVDLDTPLFMAEDPFLGGMRYRGARLELAHIGAGHGVDPQV